MGKVPAVVAAFFAGGFVFAAGPFFDPPGGGLKLQVTAYQG